MICVPAKQPQNCSCPPKPRKQRKRKSRARPRNRGGQIMVDPFLECIYGPVNYIGMGSRAPDGHAEPSIVIEHRSVVTLLPSTNGNIKFALVSSPYGAVAIDEADYTITTNNADVSTGSFPYNYSSATSTSYTSTSQSWGNSGDVQSHYNLTAFSEAIMPAGQSIGNNANAGLQASKFRVLSAQAKVSYTGNTQFDQGVAATARLTFDFDQNIPATAPSGLSNDAYFPQYGATLPQQVPDTFNEVAALPGARVFPFHQSVNLINPPTSFAYQEMRSNWVPFWSKSVPTQTKDIVFGGNIRTQLTSTPTFESTANDNVFGFGFAPVTFYSASGLNQSNAQSIVIETRTCVEYTISYSSPSARFASLPPPERPLAIKTAHNMGRLMPSSVPSTVGSEEQGWLSRAWDWYWPKEKAGISLAYNAAGRIINGATAGMLEGGMNRLSNSLGSRFNQLSIGSSPRRLMIAG